MAPSAPPQKNMTMNYESQWDGFATMSASGVAEAMYVAGVDCSVHPCCEESATTTESGIADD